MDNPITEYYEKILKGEVTAGQWIRLIYKNLVDGMESKKYAYSNSKADRAVNFIEKYCRHSKGRNDLIKLELWQKAAIAAIFGIINPQKDIRQFTEILIVVGKKNGKSLLAAAISTYVGYVDGEFGSEIYFIAPKLDQSDIVYDSAYKMIEKDKALSNISRLNTRQIYIKKHNTVIRRIAFNSKKSDGFNPSLVVNDELAAWQGLQGIKQYGVMVTATAARRQPITLSITTSGYEKNGIYDELIRRSEKFLKGESTEESILPLLYIIDSTDEWDDLEELKKANPNLGVSVSPDYLMNQITIAKESPLAKPEFMTKHCNIKENAVTAWLKHQDVAKCLSGKRLNLEDFRGCCCVAGMDLAKTVNLGAVSLIIHRDGIDNIITRFFMPSDRLEKAIEDEKVPYDIFREQGHLIMSGEKQIDLGDIYNFFISLIKIHKIIPLKIGYDRYNSNYLVSDLEAAGFHCDDVYQGTNLTPMLHEFNGNLQSGLYDFGDNHLLAAHLLNVAVDVNLNDSRLKPVKIDQRSFIDGAVSIFDALAVKSKYHEEIGKKLLNIKKEPA
ncbi:MAG: terminase large subunit [Lachnospiraceae bacterium]|nr:terminase large subunit [Lachnospiraceae bacterium]